MGGRKQKQKSTYEVELTFSVQVQAESASEASRMAEQACSVRGPIVEPHNTTRVYNVDTDTDEDW